ncbi:MAG TPA: Cof-type HAD-IIB family hydrolase, partial [Gaiellaceae bacterium]
EDRRRRRLRREVDRRHDPVELPAGFPDPLAAFAVDLDRTLIGEDAVLRPRTKAAIAATRAAGVRVIVVTGRMFRAVRPYVDEAGIDDPVICYQGAVVADPVTGTFLRHVPIPRERALEVIDLVVAAGFHLNCYVDDELYVATVTPEARQYADFQHLEIHAVGPLHDWLQADPTKLVAVGDPDALDALEVEMKAHFGDRLFISKSLPYFLEFANPGVSKGAGLQFVAERLGFDSAHTVACGDGENDRELLDWAGFAVAVANAHADILARADLVVPPVWEEGVADLLEAFVDSRA